MTRYSETHSVSWISFEVKVTKDEILDEIARANPEEYTDPNEILRDLIDYKIEVLRDELHHTGVDINWQGVIQTFDCDLHADFRIDPLTVEIGSAYENNPT